MLLNGSYIEFPDGLTPVHSAAADLRQPVQGEEHSIQEQVAVGNSQLGQPDVRQWRQIGRADILRTVRSEGLGVPDNTQD